MMLRKSAFWLMVMISIVSISFLATACAKKSLMWEEAAGRPVMQAKKEAATPEVPKVEEPRTTPAPAPLSKPEAKGESSARAEGKPAPFDVTGMRIQFAFDDYSLATRSKENLEKMATWMKSNPATRVQIQGNTCNIGTAEYNLALGEQRAKSARDYLETLGVEGSRLSTISYGLEKPRVPNTDEANRSLNRRDEFVSLK